MFHGRFHGKFLWRSAEEQAWLDVAPVGREFGSPDCERLEQLDSYTSNSERRHSGNLNCRLQSEPVNSDMNIVNWSVTAGFTAEGRLGLWPAGKKIGNPINMVEAAAQAVAMEDMSQWRGRA